MALAPSGPTEGPQPRRRRHSRAESPSPAAPAPAPPGASARAGGTAGRHAGLSCPAPAPVTVQRDNGVSGDPQHRRDQQALLFLAGLGAAVACCTMDAPERNPTQGTVEERDLLFNLRVCQPLMSLCTWLLATFAPRLYMRRRSVFQALYFFAIFTDNVGQRMLELRAGLRSVEDRERNYMRVHVVMNLLVSLLVHSVCLPISLELWWVDALLYVLSSIGTAAAAFVTVSRAPPQLASIGCDHDHVHLPCRTPARLKLDLAPPTRSRQVPDELLGSREQVVAEAQLFASLALQWTIALPITMLYAQRGGVASQMRAEVASLRCENEVLQYTIERMSKQLREEIEDTTQWVSKMPFQVNRLSSDVEGLRRHIEAQAGQPALNAQAEPEASPLR